MSEPIPESVPTSADRTSKRPTKKARWTSNSANAQAVSAQATAVSSLFARNPEIRMPSSTSLGPKTTAHLAPPPEIVANVQGSSAGAGSGEFHVYKASRRREYERTRLMDEEARREEKDRKWREEKEERERKDNEKLSKNKRRREKMKARKEKKGKGDTPERMDQDEKENNGVNVPPSKSLGDGAEAGAETANSTAVETAPPIEDGGGLVIHDDD